MSGMRMRVRDADIDVDLIDLRAPSPRDGVRAPPPPSPTYPRAEPTARSHLLLEADGEAAAPPQKPPPTNGALERASVALAVGSVATPVPCCVLRPARDAKSW